MNLHSLTSLAAPLFSLVLAVSLWGCGATPTALSGKMEVGEAKGDAQPLLAAALGVAHAGDEGGDAAGAWRHAGRGPLRFHRQPASPV